MARNGLFGRKKKSGTAMESVPAGIATQCEKCAVILFTRDYERNFKVCSRCGHHRRLTARERVEITADEGTFEEMDGNIVSEDPLNFPEYRQKLDKATIATGLADAVITGTATIESRPLVLGVADFAFIGGSMGCAVGERLVRAMEVGLERRIPVVLFTASGGARMQEGVLALMQMAKTCAGVARLTQERVPYITVLTNPTTGGVFASYAAIGDIVLAEPGATVGFAGPRVGNQDLGVRLPDNFQTSEFQLEHGMIDRVVPRKDLRSALSLLLAFFEEQPPNAG